MELYKDPGKIRGMVYDAVRRRLKDVGIGCLGLVSDIDMNGGGINDDDDIG